MISAAPDTTAQFLVRGNASTSVGDRQGTRYVTDLIRGPSVVFVPWAHRSALMREASAYASARLTELESRAHFVHEIHGTARK